jgi:acyl-CoA synthetase (AMP-forming)/AMP-acid ligase II
MVGYWRRPEETAEALRDGWLYIGDIGSLDDEGFVTILDRKKDMIISGGENIYPAKIEAVLLAQDGIEDAAVIVQPSDRWGESPVAMVVAHRLSEQQVIDGCRRRLAACKLPVAVTFIDHILRNPSGKILKRVLRKRYIRADVES